MEALLNTIWDHGGNKMGERGKYKIPFGDISDFFLFVYVLLFCLWVALVRNCYYVSLGSLVFFLLWSGFVIILV